MVKNNTNRKWYFLLTILLVIIIDQVTKHLSTSITEKTVLIPEVLWLNYITNTGAAFGLLQGSKFLLAIINVIVSFFIVKYVIDKHYKNWLPFALIVGGAIGNAIDRFFLPGVIDFIDFGWWPVFNFADSLIVIGIGWLIVLEFTNKKVERKVMKRAQTATEYMILVAVVIVIAVVVSSILGDFPGIGGGTSKKVDDFKLSTSKVGVEDCAVFDNYSLIKIRNNHFDTLIAEAVNVNGDDCNDSTLPQTLNVGASYTLNCSVVLEKGITPKINIFWTDPSTGASYATGENPTVSGDSGLSGGSTLSVSIQETFPITTDNLTAVLSGSSSLTGNITYVYNWYKDGTLNATTLITDGLVGYWPLDNDIKDYVGNKDGANYGGQIVSGVVGDAFNFTETASQYSEIANFGNLGSYESGTKTIAFWGKGLGYYLNNHRSTGGIGMGGLYAYDDGTLKYFMMSDKDPPFIYSSSYFEDINYSKMNFIVLTLQIPTVTTANTWYQANVTFSVNGGSLDENTLDFWFDGSNDAHVNLLLGNSINYVWGTVYFNTTIDELMLFNRTLSHSEIKQLYYGGLAGGNKLDSSLTTSGDSWKVGFYGLNATNQGTSYNSSSVTIS